MARKIAVCDDEWASSRQLSTYLEQYEKDTGESFSTFYFSSGEELLERMPRDTQILFLDIQMGGMTGIQAARRLREAGRELFLFFVTSHISFALEGYDVHAYAFLKKPVAYPEFAQNLTDALRQLDKSASAVLRLRSGPDTAIIHCDEIVYAEVYNHMTTLVLDGGETQYAFSLGEIEEQIGRHGFFRVHKSYLVNMKKVARIGQSDVIMKNGASVPLSRHRRAAFMDEYFSFIGGRL